MMTTAKHILYMRVYEYETLNGALKHDKSYISIYIDINKLAHAQRR